MNQNTTPGLARLHALPVQTPAGSATLHLEQKRRSYRVLRLEAAGSSHWAIAFAPQGC